MTRTEVRDANSYWTHYDDGTVELYVMRRLPEHQGRWNELTFRAPTKAECLAQLDRYSVEQAEVAREQARRRSHWGTGV